MQSLAFWELIIYDNYLYKHNIVQFLQSERSLPYDTSMSRGTAFPLRLKVRQTKTQIRAV